MELTHINDLPSDILASIFELVGPGACAEASAVCTRWSQLATRDIIWNQFHQIYLDQSVHSTWYELVNVEKRSCKSAFLECQMLLNFRPEVALDLLKKSIASESDARESTLAKVLPALSTPSWWRFHQPYLSHHNNLYHFSHRLKDILQEEDFQLNTIKSDLVYRKLWTSCVFSVACEGRSDPKQAALDEKEAFSMMRMYWSMKNSAAHSRSEGKVLVSSAILFAASYLLDIPLRTKATIFGVTNLVALPLLDPWVARFFFERITAPLAFLHFATHWTSIQGMLMNCIPTVLAPYLVGLCTPWYAQVMFVAGAALRYRYLPVSGSQGLLKFLGTGLMMPALAGILFDYQYKQEQKLRAYVPVYFPRIVKWYGSLVEKLARHRRLGYIWALHLGNMKWSVGSTTDVLSKRYSNDNNFLWTEDPRPGSAAVCVGVAVVSSLLSGIGQYISNRYFSTK